MNVAQFISQLDSAGGLARPNLFQVQIAVQNLQQNAQGDAASWLSEYVGADAATIANRLTFMCTAGELPGYQFQTDFIHLYGPRFQFPVLPTYSDVTLTFFVGADMQEKTFFDAWMFMIMEPSTNDFNYIQEYCTTVDILQVDQMNNTTYDVTLIDAYPISVAAMKVDWSGNNAVHRLDVTFTYKRLEPFNGGDQSNAVRSSRAASQQPFKDTVGTNTPSANAPAGTTAAAPTNNAPPSDDDN